MHNCLEVYQVFVSHLKLKLPCNSIMLIKAIFVGPAKKGHKGSLNAITSCKPLEGVFVTKFVTNRECNRCTNSRKQPQEWSKWNCSRKTPSFILGKHLWTCWSSDNFIKLLEKKIVIDAGSPNFPKIASLFKIASSFSHGNKAPENAFQSINMWSSCMKLLLTQT